jgi:hypothetical protein
MGLKITPTSPTSNLKAAINWLSPINPFQERRIIPQAIIR